MKVLTSNGFKDFDGIKITMGHNKLLKIITSNNKYLECTFNHLLRVKNGKFIRADELCIGDELYSKEFITDIIEIDNNEPVYDLINVDEGNHYLTNGLTSHNCVFIDEVAFVPHNQWTEFYRSTYPTISSGQESRLILVSTFNGQNHFYDMWEDAINERSTFYPTRVDWWDVPGRDEKWHEETLKNMSDEDFAQEYGNEALGSGFTLLNSKAFAYMETTKINPIQFTVNTKIFELPIPGHQYFISCDCADTGVDASAFHVIDITTFPYKQVAVFKDNKISHLMYPHIIYQMALKYNKASILVESNDVGKVILHILNYEFECDNLISTKIGNKVQLGLRTTAKSKPVGCARLKDMIESKQLIIHDKFTIEELKHFVINKSETSYEADAGYHDDLVMGLVIFAYYVNTSWFKSLFDKSFIEEMSPLYELEMLESLTPLPMFGNKNNEYDRLPKDFLD